MPCARVFLASLVVAIAIVDSSAHAQTFSAKGVKIRYLDQGKGEPVVLIHGFLSSTFVNWQLTGVVKELAKDHRVVSLDLPGHGFSERPDDKEAYGVQMVDDVVLLMDHLKIKKAHIVGYSLGGMITVKLMVKHPDRVTSAAVCGMGWFKEGSIWQKFFVAKGKDKKMGPPPVMFESIQKLAVTEDELRAIKTPVQIIVGDKDVVKALYVDPCKKVRKDWPIVEIPDGDHITCILRPQFKEAIGAWVRKNSK